MVYHVIKKIKGKKYNYLVHTLKEEGKVKKITKYLGPGNLAKSKVKELIEANKQYFDNILRSIKGATALVKYKAEFLTDAQVKWMQELRNNYVAYIEPFSEVEKANYDEYFKVRYIYNSAGIEGNTLTLGETGLVVKEGITPRGKSIKEVSEVINLKRCIDFRKAYNGDLTEDFIKDLHKLLLGGINEEAGEYKKRQNYISGTDFTPSPPIITPMEMEGLIRWYNEEKKKRHILELASMFHQKFVMIHPFADGNGRLARELFNFILSKKKFPEIIFPVISRSEYFDALEKGNSGDYKPLIEFCFRLSKQLYKELSTEIVGLENWM